MKRNTISLLLLLVFSLFTVSSVSAETKKKEPLGTWHYNVADAPYGYETGDIVLKKDDGKITGSLVFSEGYSVSLYDIKVDGKNLSFKAYVEGTEVAFDGTWSKKKIEGSITYSEGTLTLVAEPKK